MSLHLKALGITALVVALIAAVLFALGCFAVLLFKLFGLPSAVLGTTVLIFGAFIYGAVYVYLKDEAKS